MHGSFYEKQHIEPFNTGCVLVCFCCCCCFFYQIVSQTWYVGNHHQSLLLDTSLTDLHLYSRSQGHKESNMFWTCILQSSHFIWNWIEFGMLLTCWFWRKSRNLTFIWTMYRECDFTSFFNLCSWFKVRGAQEAQNFCTWLLLMGEQCRGHVCWS